MDPLQKLKKILAKSEKRVAYMDDQLAKLETIIEKMGELLNKKIVEDFLSELDVEDGTILNTAQNQKKIALIEKIYQQFTEQQTYKLVTRMVDDIYAFSGMHLDYFNELTGSKLDPGKIDKVINARLGINDKGEYVKDGFMNNLYKDPTVKNTIINFANKKVLGGTGFNDLRSGFKELITGTPETMGAFKQFFRNAAYDTYTRMDALNGFLFAEKIKLNYFIYAGTRRKTSRQFCIERKGKVFSREEALEWYKLFGKRKVIDGKSVSIAPAVIPEEQSTYNPFIDRGGYGCVDDIMWISDEIAMAKRPDLKAAEEPPKETPPAKAAEETKEENPAAFKPAASLQEAEQFAKDNLITKVGSYKGYNLNTANGINKSLFEAERAFKEPPQQLTVSDKRPSGRAYASYTPSLNQLNFKKNYEKLEEQRKDDNKRWRERYKSDDFHVGTSLDQLVKHEYAHAYDFQSGRKLYKELETLPLEVKNKLYGISGYASYDRFTLSKTRGAEMVAEVLSAKLTNSDKYDKLPAEAKSIIDKYFN